MYIQPKQGRFKFGKMTAAPRLANELVPERQIANCVTGLAGILGQSAALII